MKQLIIYWSVLLSGIGMGGCLSGPDLNSLSPEMVVETNYDQNADFGTFQTYVVRQDTIGLVSNQTTQTYIANDADDFASKVIARVTSKMNNQGYTKVNANQAPDLGVYIFVLDNFNAFQQLVYPSYYPGSYYGSYGYYGYYQPYVQTYVSQYATLVVQLVDLKTVSQSNVIWTAYIGDLYYAGGAYVDRSLGAVDQAFAQSGYLTRQ